MEFGWEPIKGWECLYIHRKEQLFLSVYVDDFKMAGVAKNLKPMWDKLKTKMDLDPPTPLSGGVYLGCGQFDIQTPVDMIREKQEFYTYVLDDGSFDSQRQCDTSAPNAKHSKNKSRGKGKGSCAPRGAAQANISANISEKEVKEQLDDLRQVRAWEYVMQGHAQKVVEKYCELAGVKENQLKHATKLVDLQHNRATWGHNLRLDHPVDKGSRCQAEGDGEEDRCKQSWKAWVAVELTTLSTEEPGNADLRQWYAELGVAHVGDNHEGEQTDDQHEFGGKGEHKALSKGFNSLHIRHLQELGLRAFQRTPRSIRSSCPAQSTA